ncbi:MAG TPA: glycosyltransferase family 2 protein [Anaerolineales bacterium]|nr:glycosyltransferase family 2 protein [Anaerolineales bacterium]
MTAKNSRQSENMVDHPKISIVTPSLNQGEFIEEAIRSVLSQGYPALEYIIMDGGSSDHTLAVLEKYSGQIKWISEKDEGQTNAINRGLRWAEGSILAYLNADDRLLPGALSKVAQVFAQNPDAMWLTGKCRIVDRHDREIRRPITLYKNLLLSLGNFPLLVMTNYISQPATFWRREVLNAAGYLDESLRYVMDYEYWMRLFLRYRPLFVPSYLAVFKIQSDSKTTSTGHKTAYVDEEKKIIERHTKSRGLRFLHDLHRAGMTTAYSLMNRG